MKNTNGPELRPRWVCKAIHDRVLLEFDYDMLNVRLTNESFVPNDPDYNPDDTGMREIHCRI